MRTNQTCDLAGLLGFLFLAQQGRLAKDAALAPDTYSQVELSRMSAAAWASFAKIEQFFADSDQDLHVLMHPYQGLIDDLELRLRPGDWWERVIKTYITIGFLADLGVELRPELDPNLVSSDWALGSDFGHGQWAREQLELQIDDKTNHDRLSLWGRRVFGDVIGTARGALLRVGRLELEPGVVRALTDAHSQRMDRAGLAG